ncbi:hypothetical protein BOX15_Mlig003883g1 [Macrostomum lignano]|uniref:Protein kinase domain-containing protein n=3 Tax=Macrostomum lignano TaxID=282301 RepID=A0A267H0B9_9PLAT|nr:hypothetical protein BOX15_Mlig003883g1 [Macrostomum lignano]
MPALVDINVTMALTPVSHSPMDAEQWGRQRFAIFLAASIGLYAGLGCLLLACIGIVWRRRRRLNRRRLRAGASSAAVSSSSAAMGNGGHNFGTNHDWLLARGTGCSSSSAGGTPSMDDCSVRLVRQLPCSGKAAIIYEAVLDSSAGDSSGSRSCVAKLFYPESSSSLAQYRSELSSYRKLERANAVTFFPRLFGCTMYTGQRPCLLLELATGGCLSDQLADRCYSWSDFCRLACALCAAVAQLHSIGRAHCRLETASFVLRGPLAPLLVGLSGFCSTVGSHLRYAAPELLAASQQTPQHHNQKRNGKLHQQGQGSFNLEQLMAADSYSLGLILWEVAIRCSAFYDKSESPPSYAPVFSDRLKVRSSSASSADSSAQRTLTVSQARAALLRPGLDYLSTANPLSASLTLPVQNHPALPFISETLAECWTPASVGKRLSPASLHARFSSLAPNFV